MAGFYLAHEQGYFTDAGLRVRPEQFPIQSQLLPLLAAGEIDAALIALSPSIFNAIAKGANIRIVAGREYANPECGSFGRILARKRAFPEGLHDASQLRGRRISSLRAGQITEFSLDTILASGGLTQADVEIIGLNFHEGLAALAGGRVDAMMSSSQFDRHPYWVSPDYLHDLGVPSLHPGFQYSQIVFGRSLLEADREAGVGFLAAYLRGAGDFLGGKTPEFLREYGRQKGLDQAMIQNACRKTFAVDGRIDEPSLELFMKWAVGKGYCDRELDVKDVVDHGFVSEALARVSDQPSAARSARPSPASLRTVAVRERVAAGTNNPLTYVRGSVRGGTGGTR